MAMLNKDTLLPKEGIDVGAEWLSGFLDWVTGQSAGIETSFVTSLSVDSLLNSFVTRQSRLASEIVHSIGRKFGISVARISVDIGFRLQLYAACFGTASDFVQGIWTAITQQFLIGELPADKEFWGRLFSDILELVQTPPRWSTDVAVARLIPGLIVDCMENKPRVSRDVHWLFGGIDSGILFDTFGKDPWRRQWVMYQANARLSDVVPEDVVSLEFQVPQGCPTGEIKPVLEYLSGALWPSDARALRLLQARSSLLESPTLANTRSETLGNWRAYAKSVDSRKSAANVQQLLGESGRVRSVSTPGYGLERDWAWGLARTVRIQTILRSGERIVFGSHFAAI